MLTSMISRSGCTKAVVASKRAHNAGHDASFARVLQNKLAFPAHGWNPTNKNIICFPEAIETMRKKDREEDAMVIYIKIIGQSTIRYLTKNTPTYDVKFAALSVR